MAAAAAPLAAQTTGLPLGTQAPEVRVQTIDGKPVWLSSQYGKGPVLIEFWATWCPNCKALEPQIAAAARKYGGKIALVGVAVGVNQSAALVKAYSTKHALPLTVLYDKDGEAADKFDVPATSHIVILNRDGRVVYTGVGSDQDIDAAIRRAL
ncbi:MAG TPA: TlpA disulfide reductase family protein [Gemmatimonadaceae bacterium]|nr:TlpA disulfide reductase family protein [Gemmatimonadaceae bacterium]